MFVLGTALFGLVLAVVLGLNASSSGARASAAGLCAGIALGLAVPHFLPGTWLIPLLATAGLGILAASFGGRMQEALVGATVGSLVALTRLSIPEGSPEQTLIAPAVVALIAAAGMGFGSDSLKSLAPWVVGAVAAAATFLAGGLTVATGWGLALGLLAAAVMLLTWPQEERLDAGRAALYALLWLGVASVAFSEGRGLGLGLAAFGGAALLIGAGRIDALAAASPLLAVFTWRAVRAIYPEVNRAFDIGQHYALIGLLVGIAAMVGLSLADRSESGPVRRLPAALLGLAAAAGFSVVLGAKGAVGLLIGLIVGAWMAVFSGEPGRTPVAAGLGLAAGLAAMLPTLAPLMDADRLTKQFAFGAAAVATVIIYLLLKPGAQASATPQEA